MSKKIKGYTRGERKFFNCRRCTDPKISGSLMSAPIPNDVRESLENKMRAKIAKDCSGGGVNPGPIPLPPLPISATMTSDEKEAEEKRLRDCKEFVDVRTSICGGPCGGKTNIYNIIPQYAGCRESENLLNIGADIVNSKDECAGTKHLGSGPRVTKNVRYKAKYCLWHPSCSGGCVEEWFTVSRNLPTNIVIRGSREWRKFQRNHCCVTTSRPNVWAYANPPC
jgi:hypothetical protein